MAKPRLGIVIPGFQAGPSDWCIPVFTNLVHELTRYAEVHVFALRYPARKETYRIGNVVVHAIGGGSFSARRVKVLSMLRLMRDSARSIQEEHRRKSFQSIAGIWATESGWLATRVARKLGVPSVVHLAGGEMANVPSIQYGNKRLGLSRLLVRDTLKWADLVTVPSGYVAQRLPVQLKRSKYISWHPGVDTSMFSPAQQHEVRDETFTLVNAASLIPVKDHAWLLKGLAYAVQHAPEKQFRLMLAGEGPLKERLQALAGQLGLSEQVEFLGHVPHDELPALYRQSDAFVLSSHYEAQCMAVLEAMSCGVSWIGPAVGALVDVAATDAAVHQPSGITVRERTIEALGEAIVTLARLDATTMRTYKDAARQRVVENYNLQAQTAQFADLSLNVQGSHALEEAIASTFAGIAQL